MDPASGNSDKAQKEPRPLRVLVATSGNWDNAASAYAVDIAAALSARGHEVVFLAAPESPAHRAAIRRKLPRIEAIDLRAAAPHKLVKVAAQYRRLLTTFRPQVINAHYSPEHVYADLLTSGKTPIARTRAGPRAPKPHLGNRMLYRRAAANIACADFIYHKHYERLQLPNDNRVLIRPSIDVERFRSDAPEKDAARRELGITAPFLVGLVARFTWAKAHTVLLDAFARLRARRAEEIELLLTGIEYDVRIPQLEEHARTLGIRPAVRFISGKLPDVRTALMALDVLAVPSIASEGIARIGLEALALGVPTVATRLNSLPEIVGDAGLLVEPNDPEGLAAALERALFDQDLRRHAAAAGPERIKRRYNHEIQLALTEQLFYRLAS